MYQIEDETFRIFFDSIAAVVGDNSAAFIREVLE
jgi:hypothetical protein